MPQMQRNRLEGEVRGQSMDGFDWSKFWWHYLRIHAHVINYLCAAATKTIRLNLSKVVTVSASDEIA